MAHVRIYIKPTCPYCRKALQLLETLGATPEVIDISGNDTLRSEMIAAANGRTTVPQVFIDGQHIGGCDDLHALHDSGGLKV